jgi:uncharacterized membrane protein
MTSARSRWTWLLVLLGRRIWFRAGLFALLGIASSLLAIVLGPLIPPGLTSDLGADSVGNILEILASSMLMVATFSLSTMIAAYSAASRSTTPRVTELLLQDTTAQNALSTFVGGFLFALVGLIGLNAGVYGSEGQLVLFALTLVVVSIIVVTFLSWVEVLSHFGRIPDAIKRTARAAESAISARLKEPYLGGRRRDGDEGAIFDVSTSKMGYVRHVDTGALQEVAEQIDANICVVSLAGAFMDNSRPLVRVSRKPSEEARKSICAAFDIGDTRGFDQDPGYGVSALAEIGVKALSPAIHDPVTALRVIDRLIQVLAICAESPAKVEPRYDRVFVAPMDLYEMYAVAFADLAQYGASDVQIGLRLQQAFLRLCQTRDPATVGAAREQSALALARAKAALVLERDLKQVETLAKQVQQDWPQNAIRSTIS